MIQNGLELLHKYGAKNLFFISAIVYLYFSIQKAEKKIEVIEASEKNNLHPDIISNNCKGRQKTAGGFEWKYAN